MRQLENSTVLALGPYVAVPEAARGVGLSASRLTHRMTDALGVPPRTWRTWFRLRHAIARAVLSGGDLPGGHLALAQDVTAAVVAHYLGLRPDDDLIVHVLGAQLVASAAGFHTPLVKDNVLRCLGISPPHKVRGDGGRYSISHGGDLVGLESVGIGYVARGTQDDDERPY